MRDEPPKVTFLLSSSFSGSTLLSRLVGEQTGSVVMGDTYLIPGISSPTTICTCGETLEACSLRSSLASELHLSVSELLSRRRRFPPHMVAARGNGVSLLPVYQFLQKVGLSKYLWGKFEEQERQLVEHALEHSRCSHYFDGSKSLLRAFTLLSFWPSAKIVHLVRDPREVITSAITKHGKQTNDPFKIADHWIEYNSQVVETFGMAPNYLAVEFRELIRDPTLTLSKVQKHCELEESKASGGIHLTGNRSRLAYNGVQADKAELDLAVLTPELNRYLLRGIEGAADRIGRFINEDL